MDKKIFKAHMNEQILGDQYGHHTTLSTEQKLGIAKILDEKFDLNIKELPHLENKGWIQPLQKAIPENFCVYPFIHLQLDPDGRVRPCCKYKVGDPTWQQNVPKMPESNIEELWNQPELQDLRSAFLKNEKPSGCKACWDEENAGIKSMRMLFNNAGKDFPDATFFQFVPRQVPKSLDLKLSNICNLKCRICNPFLSSNWIKEHKELNLGDKETMELYVSNSKEKFNENIDNKEIMQRWAKDIDQLEFYGGEPLLQQEHDKILEIFSEYGKPNITQLYYNTNGTVCNEKFFELWKKFKEVTISLSIDDIGERFEYERKNAKWDEVQQNIKLFKEYGIKHGVNLKLQLYITVGIFNVIYLQEILDELKLFDLPVVFNMVHYPHHFSLVNFPNQVKAYIEESLRKLNTNGITFLDWSPSIDNIIRYMNDREYSTDEFKKFNESIDRHDLYRGESFKITFPELHNLIKAYT
jgi:MoaA/NifB/PqqE/SkfB family radical SAM enzyme